MRTHGIEGDTDETAGDPGSDAADGGDPTAQPRSLAKDDAFHLLQNTRRRAVLRYLLEHPDEERFVMRDLAEEVAAWEHDTAVQQLGSNERQRVYIAFYQSHLPKLDQHGVIRYNQSRGVVEPTELLAVVAPYLDDGLHAECELTVEDSSDAAADGDESTLTTAVSSLFSK